MTKLRGLFVALFLFLMLPVYAQEPVTLEGWVQEVSSYRPPKKKGKKPRPGTVWTIRLHDQHSKETVLSYQPSDEYVELPKQWQHIRVKAVMKNSIYQIPDPIWWEIVKD